LPEWPHQQIFRKGDSRFGRGRRIQGQVNDPPGEWWDLSNALVGIRVPSQLTNLFVAMTIGQPIVIAMKRLVN